MEEPKENGKKRNGKKFNISDLPQQQLELRKETGLYRRLQMREINSSINPSFFNRTTRSHLVEGLTLTKRLYQHNGCVNTIRWDKCGRNLVSASDDLT